MRRVTDFFKKVTKSENKTCEVNDVSSDSLPSVSSSSTDVRAEWPDYNAAPINPGPLTSSFVDGELPGPILTEQEQGRPSTLFYNENDLGTLESGPVKPKLNQFPLTSFGKQNRSFSVAYYDLYPWMEYSIKSDAVFCYVCRIYCTHPSSTEEVFTKSGFRNWKKMKEKLDKHEKCKVHLTCFEKYVMSKQTKKSGSVMAALSNSHKLEVEKNRYYLNKIVDILVYLTSQGLALRGHDEKTEPENRGNFLELCQLFARDDKIFQERFEKTLSFCSKTIQNEIINIISSMLTEIITDEVKQSGFFSIMIDEAKCQREQQLSFCIRYVDENLVPKERFLLFKNCSNDRDAENLAGIVFNVLRDLGLQDLKIVAQTYDGASVMSGKNAGLQAKIREIYPEATFFHCYAHKVALVVTDLCRNVECSNILFNGLEALYVHFSRPSNHSFFKKATDLLEINRPFEITAQSATRWTCRYKNCEQLIKHFNVVNEALRLEIEQCEDASSVEAMGLLNTITRSDFIVNLFIFCEILKITHVLSNQLQHEEATLGGASNVIRATIETLKEKRNDAEFTLMWQKISTFAEEHDICLRNPRSSKRKKQENVRLKESVLMSTTGNVQSLGEDRENKNDFEYWKSRIYFRVIDVVTERLLHRFSEESLQLADSVDGLFDLDFDKSKTFLEKYGKVCDIDSDLLKADMAIAKKCTIDSTPCQEKNKKKIIQVRKKYNSIKSVIKREAFPNLFKAFRVAATIPISSASCERSFSAMRRIKNWLRTSMSQERFTNIALLYIEKGLLKEKISSHDVVARFAMKPRKLNLN